MSRFARCLLILIFLPVLLKADPPKEGMWLPILLDQLNYPEMREMGLELTPEQIFSAKESSLKDAIVSFGGYCTASIISSDGLLLTNHHCGYRSIQSHSSVENDLLKNGFWASNRSAELPNENLTATIIVDIQDVTDAVLDGLKKEANMAERDAWVELKAAQLESQAVENTHYEAQVKSFFAGNAYYLFITETFKDVRLVGTPPSDIGKFGGDTDNWIWPRHTGDFSLFRIYANGDNQPAEYSEDNVPYQPKHYLPVSQTGVQEGDFTMVFGFPGTTQEYLTSHQVDYLMHQEYPARIKLRDMRLEVINKHMAMSDKVRIQYASKQSSISNGWKKWQGEIRGLKKLGAVAKKRAQEKKFKNWAEEYGHGYSTLLESYADVYEGFIPHSLAFTYLNEALLSIESVELALRFRGLVDLSKAEDPNAEAIAGQVENLKKRVPNHFKNYHQPIDRAIFPKMIEAYMEDLDPHYHPDVLKEALDKYDGDWEKYADKVHRKTMFVNQQDLMGLLADYKAKDVKKITKDPVYAIMQSTLDMYFGKMRTPSISAHDIIDSLDMHYMEAQMLMEPNRKFYPDANSTLRVSYGKVEGYEPFDGAYYEPFTTLEGIDTKAATGKPDYSIPKDFKPLLNKPEYPFYGISGTVPVCFIASNHTTGGNSGSPVLNGKGELIGLNFDRNWQGTMSDIMYDPDRVRNISVDIRYILFVVEEFAGARNLVDEMTGR